MLSFRIVIPKFLCQYQVDEYGSENSSKPAFLYEICVGLSDTGTNFSPSSSAFPVNYFFHLVSISIYVTSQALRYKPEGRGFDSVCGHWDFSLT